MGRSLNKVMIIGRIQPNDPELRYTQSGQAICTFKIVTDESYKDKDGQTHERAEWHRIVFWGKAGEIIAQYMQKGRRIYVEGRIQSRQYDHEGQTRYITEIVGNDFVFLDNKGEGGDTSSAVPAGAGSAPVQTSSNSSTEDDDLPF